MDDTLRTSCAEGILRITLNRPDQGNALTPDQRNTLIDLLAEAHSDPAVRVVVLGSTGRHFCTGADLRAGGRTAEEEAEQADSSGPTSPGDNPPTHVMHMIETGAQRLVAAILDCRKPVIAVVNGTAAGIGAHMVLACDLVVASEEASLIEVFVRRGILPDGAGAYLLPRVMGMQRAKELVLLGDKLSAADAYGFGLVNRLVSPADLERTADELATRLAAGPTIALGLAKRLLNRSLDTDRGSAFFEEAMAQELVTGTEDANEGVASFVERRPTAFQGR